MRLEVAGRPTQDQFGAQVHFCQKRAKDGDLQVLAFRTILDEHAVLGCSPILRGARLILGYAAEHGGIELTQTKAFKRSLVAWALAEFDWPRERQDQPYALGRALNEHDFPPLQMLHYLLISARLARHSKGRFLITKKGADLLGKPGALFDAIVPMFVLLTAEQKSAMADQFEPQNGHARNLPSMAVPGSGTQYNTEQADGLAQKQKP
ncbi:hypothetical protein [Pseudogemmobacter faecipullorum]|uniref:Uncharacterized protein n=1 Tax=Pseudogemmobacter faecipullorum TaxID=2755041 RepID=A0ABS8CSW4_9RHOB|nr:hypothetical protein [Pseudogemmobacter faecipullorum]MCB5412273.1 hypothetical protein [Pseudogemmobacter faecipullorum]